MLPSFLLFPNTQAYHHQTRKSNPKLPLTSKTRANITRLRPRPQIFTSTPPTQDAKRHQTKRQGEFQKRERRRRKKKMKTLLQITGNRKPGAVEEGVAPEAEEQRSGPAARAVAVGVESHVQALGQGPPPDGVLLLLPPPNRPPLLGGRGRQRRLR